MIYRLILDFKKVKDRLKPYKLGKFNGSDTPIYFCDAKDPDEACYMAYSELREILFAQSQNKVNSIIDTSKLIQDIMNDIKVKSIAIPGSGLD